MTPSPPALAGPIEPSITATAEDVRKAIGGASRRGRWIWAAAAAVVLATIVVLAVLRPFRAAKAPAFDTVAVTRGDVRVTVTATGTLQAVTTVEVGAEVSGRLLSVRVDANDVVVKGQVLAEIDPQMIMAEVDQVTAQVAAADAAVRQARATRVEAAQSVTRARKLLAEGLLSAQDLPVCVLGDTVRRELFGHETAIGASLRVGAVACTVVGALTSKGKSSFGFDQDDFVAMPLATVQRRVVGSIDVGAIFVSAVSDGATGRAQQQIEALMRERRHILAGRADDFTVQDMKEVGKTFSSVTAALTALLGAIAAVSLLVGGIGIMNIMLVSVTERTREIGVRLAIGALGSEVMLQFLVEAVALSMLGGAMGVVVGVGGSFAAARAAGLPFSLSPDILLIAFGFSATVGVGFGFFPARKAARLNPIDALRAE